MDEQGYDDFFAAHHPTVHRALVLSGCSARGRSRRGPGGVRAGLRAVAAGPAHGAPAGVGVPGRVQPPPADRGPQRPSWCRRHVVVPAGVDGGRGPIGWTSATRSDGCPSGSGPRSCSGTTPTCRWPTSPR